MTRPAPLAGPLATTLPALDAEALLALRGACVVDLRSPGEFAEDRVPGAINVPLFDDEERALVGLLYHRASPQAAFERGIELVRAKIEELVARIAEAAGIDVPRAGLDALVCELAEGGMEPMQRRLEVRTEGTPAGARPLVLHCWRGGLRSQSVVALLRRTGVDAWLLAGGYKAYRARVRAELDAWQAPRAFVLRGLTGVGKTLVLRAVERLRPGWTLDLEGAAGHRSSLLGMVGLEPVSQKRFESRLAARLRAGFADGVVVLEGESRKVGDAIQPQAVWDALRGGTNLLLEADVERRVTVLMEDYLARDEDRPALRRQLAEVEARSERPLELVARFDAGRDRELVEVLLAHYYDPLYLHSEKGKQYAATVDATDPERAARDVVRWIEAARP